MRKHLLIQNFYKIVQFVIKMDCKFQLKVNFHISK